MNGGLLAFAHGLLREREPGPYKGFFDIDKLTYVLQFGAGVW